MKSGITTEEAVRHLINEFKNDAAFRESYKANIAMSFIDEYNRAKESKTAAINIYEVANNAADNFLKLLCS